jgi:hypothetical protein
MDKDKLYSVKEQITQIACDKALHQCFPTRTNQRELQSGGFRAFRVPDDGEPFGFSYHGTDIEVHVNMVSRRIKDTQCFQMVPSLSIYGIVGDGRGHLIAEKVLPTERSF